MPSLSPFLDEVVVLQTLLDMEQERQVPTSLSNEGRSYFYRFSWKSNMAPVLEDQHGTLFGFGGLGFRLMESPGAHSGKFSVRADPLMW